MVGNIFLQTSIGDWFSFVIRSVEELYAHDPVLVLALSIVPLVPILLIIGFLMRIWPKFSFKEGTNTTILAKKNKRDAVVSTAKEQSLRAKKTPLPGVAKVEITGRNNLTTEVSLSGREMMRLGREDDNDICLDDKTVHRYHAVIKRSVDAGYVISDISTSDGNGVFINGKRMREARLEDGDEINLGAARLVFKSQPQFVDSYDA